MTNSVGPPLAGLLVGPPLAGLLVGPPLAGLFVGPPAAGRSLIVLLGVLFACGPVTEEAPTEAPAPAITEEIDPTIAASELDAEALRVATSRLAGMGVEEAVAPEGVWAGHAEQMETAWGKLDERHLSAMRSWAEAELALAEPSAPLVYPFSGPDLPNALQLFPHASSYVLVGLERPGKIPDLSVLEGPELEKELARLRSGLDNLVEAGYFVTKRMETDFVAPHLEGVLPVLYLFLARAGMPPTAVRFIRLDGDGDVVFLDQVTASKASAVRLDFEADDGPRSLYYFSQDLSNPGLAAAPAFSAFLERQGAFNVYMKSASYLLHMDSFTAFKQVLLERAGAVLQDDSGIPMRDLTPMHWERRFYGTYTQTLPTYRQWFQDDLRAIFERDEVRPLSFAIGYHSRIGGSCLIWAQRRGE